ncbi:MAG: InlB B-repeat-containing protein, partial [Treponema sp.]|nr:InlB B-repeat-containing protein [Treponema sp.]
MKATQYTIIQRFKAAIAALCMVTGFAFVVGACSNPVGSHPADSNPGGSTKPDYPPDYGSPTIRVSFDLNGGEGQPPQAQLVIGGRVTLPHLPAGTDKATIGGEEYQFSGWSKERQAELVYTPGTVFPPENEAGITANTTLYAVWYRDSGGEFVQVTFHPNFEGGDEPVVQRAPPGVAVVFPPSLFQRDGYEFLGWDRNKDAREAGFEAGFRYEFDDAETEIDVYAVWSKIVWLKFHPNGVEGTVFTAEVRSGDDYTIQNNTFTPAEFYDFSGWDKNSGATIDGMLDHPVVQDVDTITIKAVTEDTMLYAIWNRPEFTVSFEPGADGAGSIEPVTKPRGEVITLPGNDAGISRDGYIVSGWADKNDENILYTLAENSFAVVRNITLVPMWRDTEAQEIEVSFDADGGVPVDAAVTPIRALQGETITLLGAVFQRDAEFHAMSGWARVRGAAVPDYELSETITLAKNQADFTLYAVWYRPEFAVTFDANGGTAPAGTVSISGLWGSEIPLHSGTGFSREHWDLAGWHTDMAGTAGSHGFYALGGEFVVPRNGAALYAVWTRPDVPVSFHANFPHGYTGSGTAPGNMAVPRGDNILLPGAGGLSVPFHRFDGWSSDPAALSGAAAGEEYQVLNDLDLYAVWNITENPGISISGPDRAMRGSTGIVFTAVLSGGVSPSDIVWKVNGNHDNTAITGDGTASGILNIGDGEAGIGAIFYESESEGSLTVSASAVFNGRSFESQAEITLYGKRMLGDWRLVKIGQDHTLAISWTGELYSWGRDNFSQLGRTGAQSEPGKVGDHNDWIIVGGALEHTLGIRRDGKPEGQGGTLWA